MAERAAAFERLWWSDALPWRLARLALAPAEAVFGAAVRARGALYDRGVLRATAPPIPAIAVGNLTVGGTGKTPFAAWLAQRLLERGERPAIVSRGVGGDELLVHRALVPGAVVVGGADRVRGVARAAEEGATVAVLDDAFQHRRIARAADIVLIAAERSHHRPRLLPAGPYREAPSALRRAAVAVVTSKRAGADRADACEALIRRAAPNVPIARVRFVLDALRDGSGASRALDSLARGAVLAVAGIADPGSFAAQLAESGARVELARFPDHHAYDRADVADLARRAARHDRAVCTLKDFVKLAPLWPKDAPPLWWASQRVHIERGGEALAACLSAVVAAHRSDPIPGAGAPADS